MNFCLVCIRFEGLNINNTLRFSNSIQYDVDGKCMNKKPTLFVKVIMKVQVRMIQLMYTSNIRMRKNISVISATGTRWAGLDVSETEDLRSFYT